MKKHNNYGEVAIYALFPAATLLVLLSACSAKIESSGGGEMPGTDMPTIEIGGDADQNLTPDADGKLPSTRLEVGANNVTYNGEGRKVLSREFIVAASQSARTFQTDGMNGAHICDDGADTYAQLKLVELFSDGEEASSSTLGTNQNFELKAGTDYKIVFEFKATEACTSVSYEFKVNQL